MTPTDPLPIPAIPAEWLPSDDEGEEDCGPKPPPPTVRPPTHPQGPTHRPSHRSSNSWPEFVGFRVRLKLLGDNFPGGGVEGRYHTIPLPHRVPIHPSVVCRWVGGRRQGGQGGRGRPRGSAAGLQLGLRFARRWCVAGTPDFSSAFIPICAGCFLPSQKMAPNPLAELEPNIRFIWLDFFLDAFPRKSSTIWEPVILVSLFLCCLRMQISAVNFPLAC